MSKPRGQRLSQPFVGGFPTPGYRLDSKSQINTYPGNRRGGSLPIALFPCCVRESKHDPDASHFS